MESIGSRLKKLRLEKGITLEEVCKKTKIHQNILKAIEEDSFVNLSPVYIKGFLKIYCKLLGVNPHDYIPNYEESQGIVRSVSYTKKKPISLLKIVTLKLVSLKSIRIKKAVFIVILILIFIMGVFNLLGRVVSIKRGSLSKKVKLPAITTATAKIDNKSQITASHKTKTPTTIKLSIRAKENCWIQLKTDGHVVFQSILRKGRFESWEAKNKIELSLGNAGALDLEVNGRLISNLGRKGQVLKNILITKEGISIGR